MGDTKPTPREAVERLRTAAESALTALRRRPTALGRQVMCSILDSALAATAALAPDDVDALRAQLAERTAERDAALAEVKFLRGPVTGEEVDAAARKAMEAVSGAPPGGNRYLLEVLTADRGRTMPPKETP